MSLNSNLTFNQILEYPRLRRAVKLVFDVFISVLAWSLSERIFSAHPPSAGGFRKWIALALIVNLGMQLTRQHYRLFGFRDAIRIAVAVLMLLGGSLLIAYFVGWSHLDFDPQTAIAAAFSTGGGWLFIRGFFRCIGNSNGSF